MKCTECGNTFFEFDTCTNCLNHQVAIKRISKSKMVILTQEIGPLYTVVKYYDSVNCEFVDQDDIKIGNLVVKRMGAKLRSDIAFYESIGYTVEIKEI